MSTPSKQKDTFSSLITDWMENQIWAESYRKSQVDIFNKWIAPTVGSMAPSDATPKILYDWCLEPIERTGKIDTTHRVCSMMSSALRWSIPLGRYTCDIAANVRKSLKAIPAAESYPAITDPVELGQFLREIEGFRGSLTVRCALRICPMLLLRPGEMRNIRWSDINSDNTLIVKLAKPGRPKMTAKSTVLIIPLPRQAVEIIELIKPCNTDSEFVFAGRNKRHQPISGNTINNAIKSVGFDATHYGFRATARTMLDEVLGQRTDLIDHQLGYEVKDPNGGAHNGTTYLPQRKQMLQDWADFLDVLKGRDNKMLAQLKASATQR